MPSDTLHWRDYRAKMHHLVVGPNNVIVLQCHDTSDAVLIDAANEHEKLHRPMGTATTSRRSPIEGEFVQRRLTHERAQANDYGGRQWAGSSWRQAEPSRP